MVVDNIPTNYDDLPLVLDMKEMQKVLGIPDDSIPACA